MDSCAYCGNFFGSEVRYYGKRVVVKRHNDHVVPRSYCNNDKADNLLPVCNICNQWKSDKMFNSFQELQTYINKKWEKATCSEKPRLSGYVKDAKNYSRRKDRGKSSVLQAVETTGTLTLDSTRHVGAQIVELFLSLMPEYRSLPPKQYLPELLRFSKAIVHRLSNFDLGRLQYE